MQASNLCHFCGLEGLKECSICKACKYCSVECQKQDWAQHKKVCVKVESQLELQFCKVCAQIGDLKCGKCKSATYCSATCQRKDWPFHKVICNTAASQKQKNCCEICSKQGDLQCCSKCKHVSYCSIACQKIDWPQHKLICAEKQDVLLKITSMGDKGGNPLDMLQALMHSLPQAAQEKMQGMFMDIPSYHSEYFKVYPNKEQYDCLAHSFHGIRMFPHERKHLIESQNTDRAIQYRYGSLM